MARGKVSVGRAIAQVARLAVPEALECRAE